MMIRSQVFCVFCFVFFIYSYIHGNFIAMPITQTHYNSTCLMSEFRSFTYKRKLRHWGVTHVRDKS